MKFSKKHLLIGIVCLISAILRNVSGISVIIPYLAFCLCSLFVGLKGKKTFGIIIVLLFGLVGLPVFDFVCSMLTSSFMTTLLTNILMLLVQTCVYFVLFVLVNSWIRKEKFSFSLATDVLAILCIAVYSVIEGLRAFAIFNAMNQTVEQGGLFEWLTAMDGGNLFVKILSGIVFYMALWCVSTRFIKDIKEN